MVCLAATVVVAPTPADTLEYVVLLGGRPRGESRVVNQGDTVLVRFQQTPAPGMQAIYRLGANGSLRAVELRGVSAAGQATRVSERFEIVDGIARWESPSDSGSANGSRPAFYQLTADVPYGTALLANFLLRQPNRTASLFPAGEARARVAADTSLPVGGARQHLRLVLVEGVALESKSVWLDERGALVATGADNWFVTVRRGAEDILPILRAIDLAHRARAAELLARRLAPSPSSAVVIRNGDVFDSERGVILPRTTVVLRGERIVAVGPDGSVAVPSGARVIDATGKTVLPGLWDMHTHRTGLNAVLMLATGVTTMRSLGAEIDVMVSHRERAEAGIVISPRVLLAGFMDGPGDRRGVPTDALVATEEEARRWVARYDSLGYRQIKLYDSVHPFLIAAIAGEAHKRGMRLSGHLPRGISVPAAVHLGFDEIHHVMHLVSTFFPDSAFIPRERAPAGVALAVARGFDVDAPRVTELLALLHERGTVIDGTFNLEQDLLNESLPDGTHPVFGTTLEWLPPLVRRGTVLRFPPERARALRAATPTYHRLLKRLFDAGVTIVPGTDNSPLAYHGELEIYERAGIPAPDVLQIATIVPARVMKEDRDYGSIAVGKVADLVIVDGQPATRIRDLRRTETVVRAGRVYAVRDLYAVVGVTPRW
jgi:cytosine/adenosine deaminase-related metal-dependent hydrolase